MDARWTLKILLVIGGILFLMAGLYFQKGERLKGVAFILAWLLPGAGHMLMGKWKKGLFFLALLGAAYAFGMHIAGWRPVSFDDNPFYFVGQYGSGATFLVAKLRGAEKAIVGDRVHPSWFDPGLLYVCVVGLLNLVIMLNILDLKSSSASAPSTPATADKAPGGTGAVPAASPAEASAKAGPEKTA
jgi:hypothetical protein